MLRFLRTPARDLTATPPPPKPLNPHLLQELERLDSLPYLSQTVTQALAIANNPDSSLADMAKLIHSDALLAAQILKRANSTTYGGGGVADLRTAVTILGLTGCSRFIASIGVRDLYRHHSDFVVNSCEMVLKHSLFTANLAVGINTILALELRGEEFTAALLHDIGRIVLFLKAPELAESGWLPEFDFDEEFCSQERSIFGTDHPGVGSLFSLKNQFPLSIARVQLNHHRPHVERDFASLVGLVSFAESLANHVQKRRNLRDFEAGEAIGWCVMIRKAREQRVDKLREKLGTLVVNAVRETRRMLKQTTMP